MMNIFKVSWERDVCAYRRRMLLEGKIENAVPAVYMEEDGHGFVLYDTAAYISLEEWCGVRDLSAEELRWIVRCLGITLLNAERCLIRPETFFLDPEHIYLSPDTAEVKFCVRSDIKDNEGGEEIQRTARLILEAIDYKDEGCVRLAYKFYHLCMRREVPADDLLALVEKGGEGIGVSDFDDDEKLSGETKETGIDAGWIDVKPMPENPSEAKRRERTEFFQKAKRLASRLLFAALVVLAAVAILKT